MDGVTKILIVSDTHRQNGNFYRALDEEEPCDLVIHCGDLEGSEFEIGEAAQCPVEMVTGNNDFFSDLPREREFMVDNYKFFVTHGHDYYVSMGTEVIKSEGKARGADVVLFGHTHRPYLERDYGLITINPGSLTYPRQEGRRPTYVVMYVPKDTSKEITFELKEL